MAFSAPLPLRKRPSLRNGFDDKLFHSAFNAQRVLVWVRMSEGLFRVLLIEAAVLHVIHTSLECAFIPTGECDPQISRQ